MEENLIQLKNQGKINESIETILAKNIKIYSPAEISEDGKCVECKNDKIMLTEQNYWVCGNCGLEYGISYHADKITGERRAFDIEEINNRKITEPNYLLFGSRTTIGKYTDDKNLSPKMRKKIYKLRMIQRQLTYGNERRCKEGLIKLYNIAQKLDITKHVRDTAWKIYESVLKKNLIMGNSVESFVSASIYTAIRIHEVPRLLEDIIKESSLNKLELHRLLGVIVRKVLPELNLKYKPVSPTLLIPMLGQELGLSFGICSKASELYNSAKNHGLSYIGKDPKGFATACLYLTAFGTITQVSQVSLSKISGTTSVTLRKRIKELRKYLI